MESDFRHVKLSESVAAAPQLQPSDMPAVAAAGYRVVVNNRPDGEALGQPTSAEMASAAEAAGLEYHYYPLNAFNYPGEAPSDMAALFDDAARPVMAFCRSGTRSTNLWITTRRAEEQPTARQHAQRLGFDVSMSER